MDETTLPLGCPECGKEFEGPTSRIKDKARFVCPSCGVAFETALDRATRETLDQVDEIDRLLGKLGKP